MEGNILVTPEELERTSEEFRTAASTIQTISREIGRESCRERV